MCVCVCVFCLSVCLWACTYIWYMLDQRKTCRNWFFSSTMSIWGIELWSLGLVPSTLPIFNTDRLSVMLSSHLQSHLNILTNGIVFFLKYWEGTNQGINYWRGWTVSRTTKRCLQLVSPHIWFSSDDRWHFVNWWSSYFFSPSQPFVTQLCWMYLGCHMVYNLEHSKMGTWVWSPEPIRA